MVAGYYVRVTGYIEAGLMEGIGSFFWGGEMSPVFVPGLSQ